MFIYLQTDVTSSQLISSNLNPHRHNFEHYIHLFTDLGNIIPLC